MKADSYRFDGSGKCRLDKLATNSKADGIDKEKILAMTAENLQKMAALQDAFYADGREGLIFVLQAMDAAGKDSTIKHVMSGLNPQGVQVTSFKQPNSEELKHDEDALVVQLHDLQKGYQMAPRVLEQDKDEFFAQRYRQIRHYEQYLYENSYRVVKIFLHVSKNEQKKRFLERIDNPAKNWKFSASDLAERAYFDDYQRLYEQVIDATAAKEAPWYALPADQKWYTRYLVSEIVVDALEHTSHNYPVLSTEAQQNLQDCRTRLEAENS